jgi:CRP-like cAMP-binding protein
MVAEPRLAGIGLLAGLGAEELDRIEQRCRWRRHRAGEVILDRDSPSRDLLLVVEGRVQVVNSGASGREVVYAEIGAGEHFGELAAIDGEPRSAAVVALEVCLLAALAPEEVEILLRRHPEIAIALLRRLARIIRHSDERIVDLSTLGALQRVWRELLRLAPLYACQRWMTTSTYFGSSSISRAWRPAFSQAISVEPEPPKGSSTMSRVLLELRIARWTSATGFMVGWRSFRAGLSKNHTSPWSRAPHQ